MIWADRSECRRLEAELTVFADAVAKMPQFGPRMVRAAPSRQPDKPAREPVP